MAEEKKKRTKLWIGLRLVVVLGIIASCGPKEDSDAIPESARDYAEELMQREIEAANRPPVEEPEEVDEDLELLNSEGSQKDFTTEITGRIKNNTARRYNYTQVTFQVYDDAGNQVGSAMANVNGLEPGAIWKFKAQYFGQDGSKFKLDKITGF